MTHRKLLDVIRDTRKTLYVVAAFYVAVGFIVAVVSLAAGALLGTFLGFLIISGTLAAAAVLRAVLRTDLHVSAMREALGQVHERLDRMDLSTQPGQRHDQHQPRASASADIVPPPRRETTSDHPDAETLHAGVSSYDSEETTSNRKETIDLASGQAKAPPLTAAILDRDVFPRLVSLLEHEAATSHYAPEPATETATAEAYGFAPEPGIEDVQGSPDTVASLNVRRMWKRALREGDLAAARRAFAAMIECVDPASIDALRSELVDLERRTERSLRRAINECVTVRDLNGLLAVLREARTQLPGHPMADECARLEVVLRRRAATSERVVGGTFRSSATFSHDEVQNDAGVRLCASRKRPRDSGCANGEASPGSFKSRPPSFRRSMWLTRLFHEWL